MSPLCSSTCYISLCIIFIITLPTFSTAQHSILLLLKWLYSSVYCYVCTVKFTQVSGHTSEGGNVVWAVSRYGLPIAELDWYPLLSVPPFDIHGVNFRSHSLPSAAGIFAQLLWTFCAQTLCALYVGENNAVDQFFFFSWAPSFWTCLKNFAVKKSEASIENLFRYLLNFIKQKNIKQTTTWYQACVGSYWNNGKYFLWDTGKTNF